MDEADDGGPISESEALAMLKRALQARLAELATSGERPPSGPPSDIETVRAKLHDRLRRLSLCDDAACQRAGRCRNRRAGCGALG